MARWTASRRAFATTPDRSRVYPATVAEAALARLRAGLDDGEGVVALTGPAGTGKTLLVYRLLEGLGRDRRSVLLTNSHFADRSALLQACLFDLGLPHDGQGPSAPRSEQDLRLTLTAHLLETLTKRGGVVLAVDEAHHLTDDQLEELRLLGNLEAGGRPALQVVLAGLPELDARLESGRLAALAQRLATRVRLDALDLAEAVDYQAHLLRTAGPTALEAVPDEVRLAVAAAARGVPRRMNQLLREALRVADECDADVADVEMVQEAAGRLGLVDLAEPEIRFDPLEEDGHGPDDPLAA